MDKNIVLFIGNGFDLDLGLQTSYSNFVNNDYFQKPFIHNQEIPNLFLNDADKTKMNLYTENKFAQYINLQNSIRDWIDLENEIIKYNTLHNIPNEMFYKDWYAIKFFLWKYITYVDECFVLS